MSEFLLFLSAFGIVFFLGFQSLAVNSGQYWIAAVNSFIIGCFHLFMYKTAPQITGEIQIVCYLTGGPLGIICAMWAHRNIVPRWKFRAKS